MVPEVKIVSPTVNFRYQAILSFNEIDVNIDYLSQYLRKAKKKKINFDLVVRYVALYDSECWLTTKHSHRHLTVMVMKMSRWSNSVTSLDHVRNEDIGNR